jgi:glycosyltransferase involved in cell wall biosynthesis
VVVIGKNEEIYIGKTLSAILNQDIPIEGVVFVDDGSTDNTREIAAEAFYKGDSKSAVIARPSRVNGPYVVGQPGMAVLVNIGFDYITTNWPDYDFVMIMGSSLRLSPDYASQLVTEFEKDPDLVIASGGIYLNNALIKNRGPYGAGRMISRKYFKWYGERYPIYYGWESEIIYAALRIGKKTTLFPNAKFYSLKGQRQQRQNYTHWGRGMRAIGYSMLFAIARSVLLAKKRKKIKVLVQSLAGYFSSYHKTNELNEWEIERTGATNKWLGPFQIKRKTQQLLSKIGL